MANALVAGIALAGTAVAAGAIIKLAGYVEGVTPGLDVTERMKVLLIAIQCVGLATAFGILLFYPLTRKSMEAIQEELKKKKATAQEAS